MNTDDEINIFRSRIIERSIFVESYIEAIVSMYFSKEKSSEFSELLLEDMNFDKKIKCLKKICLYNIPNCPLDKWQYEKLMQQLFDIKTARNTMAHEYIKIHAGETVKKDIISGKMVALDKDFKEKFNDNILVVMNNLLRLLRFIRGDSIV